jgi:hypothetical protein
MKLKELDLKRLQFIKSELKNGTIVNVSYKEEYGSDPFLFQIPKGVIEFVNTEYLILNVSNKKFESLIKSIEQFFEQRFGKPVESILDKHLKLKLKFSKSLKPEFKVINNDNLYNFYNLSQGDTVICVVSLEKVWISEVINYNLKVKEINLKNKI